ncbi:hypothetical protein CBS147333_7618 [Penicillium roqueforti]|uniref:uncharacterized protein n=1 Tax=Penicillium roqueforti TaxID=5082 RepID=UPI00190921A3|nr:uncharacterized protein LCP9604111_3719 [Penicillium roqueforti]KAF9250203.1 hypothetical protein LCP9604111_3719 [Penicillium roqueforti]KAI2700949.1 hypothetical protein CBS147372_5019 [Penicillium roqueforti]KAI2717159.1 hypothetical protein CBS147318_5286 [Penicillium roqueforti]KAI2727271.1 hypothetical protein CBS147354_3473 [Penicillium roqueforti]KAI3103368.1 hypothetical protein CBS147333_7618 [Penicillium roqueforti]
MASVKSRVFAITGGASGIGAATSRLLAERGATAVCVGDISCKNFDELKESMKKINPATEVHCSLLDVTSPTEVEKWVKSIVAKFGNLHGAANIAGIAQGAGLRNSPTILEEGDEEWSKVLKVNLDGVFYCTRAEVRAMKSLPSDDRSIVNVGSIAALSHIPDVYAYGTSKGASTYFTTCVAADTFPFGIRVNSVSPGITDTPLLPQFMPKAQTSDEVKEVYRKEGFSVVKAGDVARTIVWLLSEDSSPVYGANINVGASMP